MNKSKKVHPQSLPYCLRHCFPDSALEEAKAITIFLSQVNEAFADYDCELESETRRGMGLVFALLLDKLEIGTGSYPFPMVGDSDEPVLIERDG